MKQIGRTTIMSEGRIEREVNKRISVMSAVMQMLDQTSIERNGDIWAILLSMLPAPG